MSTPYKFEQIGTSFPGDNNKHIDYVIKYKHEYDDASTKQKRINFFNRLKEEGLETYEIKIENKDEKCDTVYVLVNCSLDRLLKEAENIKLEMRLKTVNLNINF